MRTRTIVALAGMITMLFCANGCTASTEKTETKAKYIFLFIGDGMGNSQVAVTEASHIFPIKLTAFYIIGSVTGPFFIFSHVWSLRSRNVVFHARKIRQHDLYTLVSIDQIILAKPPLVENYYFKKCR